MGHGSTTPESDTPKELHLENSPSSLGYLNAPTHILEYVHTAESRQPHIYPDSSYVDNRVGSRSKREVQTRTKDEQLIESKKMVRLIEA